MNPCNELERILAARDFGPQVYPELFRLLRESPLIFLLPYHPELMDVTVSVNHGDDLPQFVVWYSPESGRRIPIFTSPRSANEACKKIGAREHQFAFAEMDGKGLFDLLACQPDPIVINPSCRTNSFYLDLIAVKKLADGSILTPETGETIHRTAQIVDPADYPTDFVQPLFAFLRKRPPVRAAWLFRELSAPGTPTCYIVVVKTTDDGAAVEKDLRIIAGCVCPKDMEYGVVLLDPNNAEMVKTTSAFTPFYAAPDYKSPCPWEEPGPSGVDASRG